MSWWVYVLLGFYTLTCVVLVAAVLLQPGKSDAAALFGGGASQTAFGPRGTVNILGWTTWVAAAIMVTLALVFSLPQVMGPSSVIQGGETPAPIEQPAQPPESGSGGSESQQPAAGSSETKPPEGTDQNPSGGETKPEDGTNPKPNKD